MKRSKIKKKYLMIIHTFKIMYYLNDIGRKFHIRSIRTGHHEITEPLNHFLPVFLNFSENQ